MYILSFFFRTIGLSMVLGSCMQSAGRQPKLPLSATDTFIYAPPTPVPLATAELGKYQKAIQSFYDDMYGRNPRFNGSILVAKNGTVIFEQTKGYFNPLTKKDSLNSNSSFHIASVSKTFTAMAVLRLMEKGKLKLEDDLSLYFNQFPYPGTTIKMLLSHRSGLPNYVHYLKKMGWNDKRVVSNQEVLASLYSMHPPLCFPTGTHFSYCNTNYALLALIIEKVSGKKYPQYMQENIFNPLGMTNTYVYTPAQAATAMPSVVGNRTYAFDFLDEVYGDKNIYSTTQDILKWDQALYSGQFLQAATLDSAFTGYSFEKEGKRNYGLGWRITYLDNGKKIIYHNGWWHGNNAAFIRLIDEKATIIVLGNWFTSKIYKAKKLCDVFGNYNQNSLHELEEQEHEEPSSGTAQR
jgi:CubicO group peptidase (beta-lactamase class C family)